MKVRADAYKAKAMLVEEYVNKVDKDDAAAASDLHTY